MYTFCTLPGLNAVAMIKYFYSSLFFVLSNYVPSASIFLNKFHKSFRFCRAHHPPRFDLDECIICRGGVGEFLARQIKKTVDRNERILTLP